MEPIARRTIDRKKTGRNLQLLREDDIELRRFVCRALRKELGECDGNCPDCRFDMDNHISRNELAKVFNVSESVICNWESGRTMIGVEDLLFYAQITGKTLDDILVFE